MKKLIESARADGRLALEPVDAEFIVRTQAAGLRHRRDGLAYRLSWLRREIRPRKRVAPSSDLPPRRKLVYRLRYVIARLSHPMLRVARMCRTPALYTWWARSMLRLYQALTWSRGRLGQFFDTVMPQLER